MGLRFVFGGSGSGKSKYLHDHITKWADQEPKRNFLFLVPDQFTMQTQIDLVSASSCGGIMNIDVLSFGRLAHRIFEETGYGREPVLDDTGKSLVLRRVAAALEAEMPVIGRNLNKIGYIHEVKSAISEFMQYGISSAQVGELAEYASARGALHYKLKDLQTIYQGFLEYIRERYVTTEETLELLTRAVSKSRIIRDSVVVFDGFTGFTPIQYRLIQEMLLLTKEVIISITIDISEDPFQMRGEQELFHLSKKTVADLCRLAKEVSIRRAGTEDVYMQGALAPRFWKNRELAHLEKHLFRYPLTSYQEQVKTITVSEALNPAWEVRQCCIRMKKLVLEEGYCYRDIAVVVGDLETYADYFEREAAVYEIPLFMDRTRGLLLNPFIEYIRSAFQILLRNFSYESVFHFLRCGLADFTREEVDRLENYVLAMGIKGKSRWQQVFVRLPDQGAEEGKRVLSLERLNDTRRRLVEQLSPLAEKRETAGELVRALYEFIVAGRIQEKLHGYEQYFQEIGETERAREYAQIYRLVMELLEQIVTLLDTEPMDLREFAEILDAGFQEIEVGIIPGSIDRVVVGDMERTRLKQVKVLLFLGVNDGNIPRGTSKGGLLSDIDREFLQTSPFELAPTPRQQMYIQRLYLYMNMTKPSERLYLSYARVNSQGKSIRPSYLVNMLCRLFPGITIQKTDVTESPFDGIIGRKDGLFLLAQELRDFADGREGKLKERELLAFYRFYQQDANYNRQVSRLSEAAFEQYIHKPLAKAVAKALYGSLLENSVSRLERYAACAYSHFLQYGLMLREREEYSFEQADLGNIFHGVLELFAQKLREHHLTWFDFTREQGEQLLREAFEETAARYGEAVLYSSSRYEYMSQRMLGILQRTIQTLQVQLREGSFLPESFEMSFSRVEELSAVNIALSEGERMKLRGRIDRIDLCEDEEHVYVKVIDYKSGNRRFDLAALYYGLQLQLVVYMNVATEITARQHPNKEIVPAALLYYHVNDPLVKEEGELSPEEINRRLLKELRMTGVVSQDDRVISLLDRNFTDKSVIIPVERRKDGTFSARSGTIAKEDYEVVSEYVNHKIRRFGREILDGNLTVNPCEQGGKNSCTWCAYAGVCGFDEKIPGYQLRQLSSPPEEELLARMRQELEEKEPF